MNRTEKGKGTQEQDQVGGATPEKQGEETIPDTPVIKFPTDMASSWEAHQKLDVGLLQRFMAKGQVALIRSKVAPWFDPRDFEKGAGFAYRSIVAAAMEPEGQGFEELARERLISSTVSEGLLRLVEEGKWLGWGELKGGNVVVHDLHSEIVHASLVWPEDHTFGQDFSQIESALFDVRFLAYESLQLDKEAELQPRMIAQTWRFEGKLLASNDNNNTEKGGRLPNEELQYAIVKIDGLEEELDMDGG
jgi:hypothetical protein